MKDYFEGKKEEQEEWGRTGIRGCKEPINQREMTNVGCFRYYIKNYLLNHPKINENGTILVRQLNPTDKGLPIQIYAFTKPEYAGWVETEELSSDIIDWVFAIAKRFDVKIYVLLLVERSQKEIPVMELLNYLTIAQDKSN